VITERVNQDRAQDDRSLSALYRRTRSEQPSAALDEAIRQQSRRRVGRIRRLWLVPLSTAAVLVLGISLTLKVVNFHDPRGPAPSAPSARVEAEAAAPLPTPVTVDETSKAVTGRPSIRRSMTLDSRYGPRQASESLNRGNPAEPFRPPTASESTDRSVRSFSSAATPGPHAERHLERIRRLLADGDMHSAQQAVREFRERFPNNPVPPDIQAKLRQAGQQ
jgi:hypothetical protein